MQTVTCAGAALWPPLRDACRLFSWASAWPVAPEVDIAPAWQPYLDKLAPYLEGVQPKSTGMPYENLRHYRAREPGRAVVMFSGGKDSLATALKLQAQGWRPALLHVTRLNGPAYTHECNAARDIARRLHLPFADLPVRLDGKSAHIENPVKNVLLAAIGGAYAAVHGAQLVALGLLENDTIADNVRCGLSDNPSLTRSACDCLAAMQPGIAFAPVSAADDADSIETVMTLAPQVLPLVSSCMGARRFKASLAAKNEARFGIKLLPGRCGSCYKCAFELVALAALKDDQLAGPLAAHCVAKVVEGVRKIRGPQAAIISPAEALQAMFGGRLAYLKALGV